MLSASDYKFFSYLILASILVTLIFIYGMIKIEADKGKLAILLTSLSIIFYIVAAHML